MDGYEEKLTGSPAPGEPAFLVIGKVRRPHGVSGEVLVEVYTDFPERLQPKRVVYAGKDHIPLTITFQRSHHDGILLTFDGFATPESVGRFRNQILYLVADDAKKLPDGEYYHHELLGLTVMDETGESLGKVTEIIETGANDVYVVSNGTSHEILLPAIAEVILEVDLKAKLMKVHLLPGLVEDRDHNS